MPGLLLTAWEVVLDRLREVVLGKAWKVMPDLLPTVPFTLVLGWPSDGYAL